ncbi:MAG: hypothetical protein HYW91_00255, partial [Candidatus Sungbacteria bacterium]|nr:hypothetical protein [Candidatus Sungbacteria bacterium]
MKDKSQKSGAPPTGVGDTSHFGGGAEPRTESQLSHHSSAGRSRRLSGALGNTPIILVVFGINGNLATRKIIPSL